MAHDLFFRNSPRSWSRGVEATSSSGSHLFESRRDPTPLLIVRDVNRGPSWFGYALGAVAATKLVSGKWPWELALHAAKKLESKG